MILEAALMTIKKGEEAQFEKAMAKAKLVISASPGFRGMEIGRSIENPQRYLLRVWWNKVEDHTVGFRESARFKDWRGLIGPYFDGTPAVEHYQAPFESIPVK